MLRDTGNQEELKSNHKMADEKQFTIPLRKEFSKAPSYKRSEKAIKAIREFIERHMKTDDVKIGKNLNLKIFERGRKNPPPRIKVKAIKEDKFVRVELPEFPFDIKVEKKEKKKETKTDETKHEHKHSETKKEVQTESASVTQKVEEVKETKTTKEKQETKTETKEIKADVKREEKIEVKEVIGKSTEEKLDTEKSKR